MVVSQVYSYPNKGLRAEPFRYSLRLVSMGIAPGAYSGYRVAFAEFADKVRKARALMAATNPDWQAIDVALLDLERARVNYNQHRDILAQQLLSSSSFRIRSSLTWTG